MRMNTKTAVITTVFLLVPCGFLGQQIDPSVQPVDPSVNPRVQDVDHPDSALLPGGSSAWTGQPIMSQMPSASTQKDSAPKNSQFPSLTSMSTWGTTSVVDSSASNARNVLDRARGGLPSRKTSLSRKLNMTLATTLDLHSTNTDRVEEETAAAENQLTRTSAALELRELRRETSQSTRSARLARLRAANPLVNKADAASAGLWHSDQSSAYALNQQQHETNALLQHGFTPKKKPRRRHREVHTPGEEYTHHPG